MHFVTDNERAYKRRIDEMLNYQFTVEDLYCKFTKFMIDSMNNLDILSRAGGQNDNVDNSCLKLPSWVPSFHCPGFSSFIDNTYFNKYNAAVYLGTNATAEGKPPS